MTIKLIPKIKMYIKNVFNNLGNAPGLELHRKPVPDLLVGQPLTVPRIDLIELLEAFLGGVDAGRGLGCALHQGRPYVQVGDLLGMFCRLDLSSWESD